MKDHAAAADCVKKYEGDYEATTKATSTESRSRLSSRTTRREERTQSKSILISAKDATTVERWATSLDSATPAETMVTFNIKEEGSRGGYRRRSRSRSRSEDSDRHKKSKRRHRSDSSDRGRSHSPKSKKCRRDSN